MSASGAIGISISVRGSVPSLNPREALGRANRRVSRLGLAAARVRLAPHNKTGETMRDLRTHPRGADGVEWYDSAPQALFLEEGTKAHTIEPTAKSKADARAAYKAGKRKTPHAYLRFSGGSGPVFARKVNHPGTSADPWLSDAIHGGAPVFEGVYESEILKEWRG